MTQTKEPLTKAESAELEQEIELSQYINTDDIDDDDIDVEDLEQEVAATEGKEKKSPENS